LSDKSSLLLLMLSAGDGKPIAGKTRLIKMMYLAGLQLRKLGVEFYDFYIHHYGPFTSDIEKDLNSFIKDNYIRRETKEYGPGLLTNIYAITPEGQTKAKSVIAQLEDHRIKNIIDNVKIQYNDIPLSMLIMEVHKHPETQKLKALTF